MLGYQYIKLYLFNLSMIISDIKVMLVDRKFHNKICKQSVFDLKTF